MSQLTSLFTDMSSTATTNQDDISPPSVALDPIVIKGYKFFNSRTKENILIKGIDYYPRPNSGSFDINSVDFFTEEFRHVWERDIPQFQALGVNAIRLYAVDPAKDHSSFMCAMSKAGIYVLVELASGSCPSCAITSKKAPHCYPPHLKVRGEAVIKEFSKYTNTLAFSAGNEVNHFVPLGDPPEWNAPCLKKFVRDMRAYMDRCDHIRHVPIGLIMADSDRDENTLYYNCQSGDDELDHAEWYGINSYVYCNGTATEFNQSTGFQTLQQSFESYNYSIPVLLTEFGCLSKTFPTIDGYVGQRNFNQAKWLGLKQVQDDFAGGMVFEYSMEAANAQVPIPYKKFGQQNYGVGYFYPDNCDDVEIMCEYNRTPSFYQLKKAYAQVKPEKLTLDDFTPDEDRTGRTVCPANFPKLDSFFWAADWKPSLTCPPPAHDTWTCPADNDTFDNGTTIPPQQNGPGLTLLISLIFLIGVVYIILKALHKESVHFTRSSLAGIWNDETEAKPAVATENIKLIDSDIGVTEYLSVSTGSESP